METIETEREKQVQKKQFTSTIHQKRECVSNLSKGDFENWT